MTHLFAPERLFAHAPYRFLLDNLDFIQKHRVNCEIYVDGGTLDAAQDAEIDRINRALDAGKLGRIVHGPFKDLNPGSSDPKAASLCEDRFLQALDFCEKVRARNLVLHAAFNPTFHEKRRDQFVKRSLEIWGRVAARAKERKITLCLENSLELDPSLLLELIAGLKSPPHVKLCFDAAHYHAFGWVPLLEALGRCPLNLIGEVHLSDNRGQLDEHLPLGHGDIPWAVFFRELVRLNLRPIMTLEPLKREDLVESLSYLKVHGWLEIVSTG